MQGCDASIMIENANGDDEKHNFDNQFLRQDGYRTVMAAKAAVDADPQCTNKVSCADIIALATRDAVVLVYIIISLIILEAITRNEYRFINGTLFHGRQSGGPTWNVELGRYDGKISTQSSVNLPGPKENYDQLMNRFAVYNLSPTDMVALSGKYFFCVLSINSLKRKTLTDRCLIYVTYQLIVINKFLDFPVTRGPHTRCHQLLPYPRQSLPDTRFILGPGFCKPITRHMPCSNERESIRLL
jgi:Peroxidase